MEFKKNKKQNQWIKKERLKMSFTSFFKCEIMDN